MVCGPREGLSTHSKTNTNITNIKAWASTNPCAYFALYSTRSPSKKEDKALKTASK
jgi:hypothetical protein